jgi:endonuclease/exonuclease/phosphatase family metal-dependent hydrolase
MAPYQQAPTILMGDTNVSCLNHPENCREYQLLSQADWHLALASDYMIDQIWTSPGLVGPVEKITFPAGLFAISDHYPVGAVIQVP